MLACPVLCKPRDAEGGLSIAFNSNDSQPCREILFRHAQNTERMHLGATEHMTARFQTIPSIESN